MRKTTTYLFLACALLFSCVKEEVLPESVVQEEVKTYTLTIEAGNVIYVDATSTLIINDSSPAGTGTITGGNNTDNYNPYGGGINGVLLTSKVAGYTTRSIFLPAGGVRTSETQYDYKRGGLIAPMRLRLPIQATAIIPIFLRQTAAKACWSAPSAINPKYRTP